MVCHTFGRKQSDPRKEAAGARARHAVEDLNGGHQRKVLGVGRLSRRRHSCPTDVRGFEVNLALPSLALLADRLTRKLKNGSALSPEYLPTLDLETPPFRRYPLTPMSTAFLDDLDL